MIRYDSLWLAKLLHAMYPVQRLLAIGVKRCFVKNSTSHRANELARRSSTGAEEAKSSAGGTASKGLPLDTARL